MEYETWVRFGMLWMSASILLGLFVGRVIRWGTGGDPLVLTSKDG